MSTLRANFGMIRIFFVSWVFLTLGAFLAYFGLKPVAIKLLDAGFDLNPRAPIRLYSLLLKPDMVAANCQVNKGGVLSQSGGTISDQLSNADELVQLYPWSTRAFTELGDAWVSKRDAVRSDQAYKRAIILSGFFRESDSLSQQLSAIANNDMVVITQVAINYLPMFNAWYGYFSKLKRENLLVIALDPVVYLKLSDQGLNVYYLPRFAYQAGVRSILWWETVKLRRRILEQGVSYLHTDIDAFWLEDAVPDVMATKGDIVASIGYGTPRDAVKAWGFVPCLGFYLMRSNEVTRKLYPRQVKYTYRYGHDQNGLGMLLLESGIGWTPSRQHIGGMTGVCKRWHLAVEVLPDSLVTRDKDRFQTGSGVKVFHPALTGSDIFSKLEQLKSYGIDV